MPILLQIEDLEKRFPVRTGLFSRFSSPVQAVRRVSLTIGESETVGLVGESGCGKTTLGRMIVRLVKPDGGRILYRGAEIASSDTRIQMIFQDPYSSLNPRMSAGEIIAEPLLIHRRIRRGEKRSRVGEWLKGVGLPPDAYDRYPHEFSGGQRQRIGIARALVLLPDLVVADEPVSSLDVSIAADILALLKGFRKKYGVSYLFIAHDLRMVKYMSDRIAVMYLGKIVELATRASFERPLHPYTEALVAAVPVADPGTGRKKILLSGEVPSPIAPPSGCAFHPRCPYAEKRCRDEEPELKEWRPGHWAACHLVEKIHG